MAKKQNISRDFAPNRLVFLQDLALSVAASLLSILLVRSLTDPIPGFSTIVWIWLAVALAGTFLGGFLSRIWRMELRFLNLHVVGKLFVTVFVKEILLVVFLLVGILHLPTLAFCILAVAMDTLLTAVFLLAPRYVFTSLRREERAVSRTIGRKTALVVGTGDSSVALAASEETSGRCQVIGFLTNDRGKEGLVIDNRVVYFCEDVNDLHALQWRLGGIDNILFPLDWESDVRTGDRESERNEVTVPEKGRMTLVGYALKRGFDVVLSGVLLVLFSPLIGLCALAIYREDGKPVIYRQERIGKNGRPFEILKFRSMRLDAEAGGRPALYAGDDDPRLTKVGKFLRQHHLDELPQLWNVFRGDMSFIGYRPERQYYIDQIMARNPRYRYLYQIRPGVTSYATLYNGYTDTLEKMLTRLDLDLYYLRNHSVLFDAKVLGLTFLRIVTGRKF